MVTFSVGGNDPGGRLMGLLFVVLGGMLLLAAAGFALYTASWMASYKRFEGTVVAIHSGHAVVEGASAAGDIVHVVDGMRTDPPPVIGSSRTLAMPEGHPGDAVVVGINTWFVSVLLGGIGIVFSFVGVLAVMFGASRRRGPASSVGPYDQAPGETTIINNYYRDDGTTYTS